MTTPRYASFEAMPCRFTESESGGVNEAWVLLDRAAGEWKKWETAEIGMNAAVLTAAEYRARFGDHVPPLPKAAFQSGG